MYPTKASQEESVVNYFLFDEEECKFDIGNFDANSV